MTTECALLDESPPTHVFLVQMAFAYTSYGTDILGAVLRREPKPFSSRPVGTHQANDKARLAHPELDNADPPLLTHSNKTVQIDALTGPSLKRGCNECLTYSIHDATL